MTGILKEYAHLSQIKVERMHIYMGIIVITHSFACHYVLIIMKG